ncbi:MAG: hypothetical protein H6631_08675 [Anaerolineaceae bacterium]|nr:hypothetical protein [Anaerolineaceae bacterium]
MRKHMLIWTMLVVLMPTLACGLSGGSEEPTPAPVEAEAEAPAEPVVKAESTSETATASEPTMEAESSTEDSAESVAPAATKEVSEEPTVEAETVEVASAETEEVELPDTPGLESLSAYRVSFVMQFDGQSGGQPAKGTIHVLLESTQEPAAKHMSLDVEGSTVDQLGGVNHMDVYDMGDTIYMYNNAMGGQWISMPGDNSDMFNQGFFAPDENLDVPDTASCASGTETINGIEAKLCTFDATDLKDLEDATFDKADGKIWLAEDGGYVVKYEVAMQGYKPKDVDQQDLFKFGDVTLTYEILDVDSDISIELPAAAKNAQSLDFGGMADGDEPVTADVPVLDDAEQLFTAAGVTTYKSTSSLDVAVEFYRQSLTDEGWTEDDGGALITDSSALLSFEKDGSTLTVSISQEDGGKISVSVISS